MTGVLHRSLQTTLPTVRSGKGLWLWDSNGKEYLDAVSGGAAVSCLGHGDVRITQAIVDQLNRIAYTHGSFFTSDPAEALAKLLLQDAPRGMERVLFCSGGSEATDTALKLVRQSWVERGRPRKTRIIARKQSYHGATLGALSISGNPARRQIYAPMLFDAHFIEPCYAYRNKRPDESDADYGLRAADALESAIIQLGPESVAAFIAEPVVGATLGCAPAVEGYLARIREICDCHEVLLILDEIMCGSGRTGLPYTCLDDSVTPDLITIAKGLGGGYQPIGAVLVGHKLVDALSEGSGVLKHGFTYMGHPVACAAALAVQNIIRADGLLENVRTKGAMLSAALNDALDGNPRVGDIRGRGLFLAVEFVADRATKTPFDPLLRISARIKASALNHGLMVYPGTGTVDGHLGDHILFAPAYTVNETEIMEIVNRFVSAVDDALRAIPA